MHLLGQDFTFEALIGKDSKPAAVWQPGDNLFVLLLEHFVELDGKQLGDASFCGLVFHGNVQHPCNTMETHLAKVLMIPALKEVQFFHAVCTRDKGSTPSTTLTVSIYATPFLTASKIHFLSSIQFDCTSIHGQLSSILFSLVVCGVTCIEMSVQIPAESIQPDGPLYLQ